MSSREDLNADLLNASWSRFWTGAIETALPEAFPEGYDGPMAEFWKEQLNADFERIVDLATGNGALVWMAHDIQSGRVRPARITGVDLASIDPFSALKKSREDFPTVDFIGNTSVDALPFDDHSIDIVISQYGIEYSDLEKTIAEIARVLMPTGKVCCILHDQRSTILAGMHDKLMHCNDMIADTEFHELTQNWFDTIERIGDRRELQQSAEFQALAQRINAIILRLKPRLDQYPKSSPLNVYIHHWYKLMNPALPMPVATRKQKAREAFEQLQSATENLKEVAVAGLDDADRARLAGYLGQQGFGVSRLEPLVYTDGKIWGTQLIARRES